MKVAQEHALSLMSELLKEYNINGNEVYNDWEALLKLNRGIPGDGFGEEEMVDEYIITVISGHIKNLIPYQLRLLSEEALSSLDILAMSQDTEDGYDTIENCHILIHRHLFQLIDKEANDEYYFDEHDHEMSDILSQMNLRIHQLKKIDHAEAQKLAEELDYFHDLLYGFE